MSRGRGRGVSRRRIRLTIDSDLGEVWKVRRAFMELAEELAEECPFPPEECLRIKTCVGEAVNNAIIHAYDRKPGNPVEVEVDVRSDRVVCRIGDRGRPMPEELLARKPSLDYSPKDIEGLPEGGMGLYIIRRIMDKVEYRSVGGRNELVLTKLVGRETGGAAR